MALLQSALLPPIPQALVSLEGRDPDGTVIWLRGEHDLSTIPALADVLAGAIAIAETDLVLDLSEVEFMDATTVGVIMRAQEFLRFRSRSLELRSPSRAAQRVLRLCGVADLVAGGPAPDLALVQPPEATPTPSALREGR